MTDKEIIELIEYIMSINTFKLEHYEEALMSIKSEIIKREKFRNIIYGVLSILVLMFLILFMVRFDIRIYG